jgi:UDP-N-acetyl-D-mannosaminuronate dehydrogenase
LEFSTPLIKCARVINESKAEKVANRLITLIKTEHPCDQVNILLLGFAYKANTGDIRNTKVADIYKTIEAAFLQTIDCFDSHVDVEKVKNYYQIVLLSKSA